MTRAYSIDLRERAVDYFLSGGKKDEVCRIFKVSADTLYNWLRQYREMGDLSPKRKGSRPWKLDHPAIIKYVESHSDSTLQEIAEYFQTGKSAIDYSVSE